MRKTFEDDIDKKRVAGIQGAIKGTLLDTIDGDFASIRERFRRLLEDLAADAVAKNLTTYLFGDNGKTGLVGGFLASIPGFASGGDHAGGLRLVGERGPELEVTGPSRIFNASQTNAMLGGGGVTIVNNVAAGPTRGEVLAAIQQANSATEARLTERLRRSGLA